jgi:transcription antitermination factor NusG
MDDHLRSTRVLSGDKKSPDTAIDRANWYAIRTRSRCEWKVSELLRRAGVEEFLPAWTESVRWSDRAKKTLRPLFPGYVFARFSRFAGCSGILALPAVVQILGTDELASICDDEIANLRRVAALPVSPCPYVAAGEIVTITSGPLIGVSGVVVRNKGALRLIVSVEMLGQACAVEIDAVDVETSTK